MKKESKRVKTKNNFCNRVSNEDHLSRIKCADLFLDTFNVNAHTTASDALWAGVPIITKQGKSFSARSFESFNFLNLEEFIVANTAEYEEKAFNIAINEAYLKKLKHRLNENKFNSSLFDSKKFTRNIEEIYVKLVNNL